MLLTSACAAPAADTVVVVSIDTLRADGVASYGGARPTSAHLDALAAEGVRFAEAFAPAPWTLPSHASLFTALYPLAHGARSDRALPNEAPTLTEFLRESGFATAGFVSVPYLAGAFGFDRGFDVYEEPAELTEEKNAPDRVDRALELLEGRRRDPVFLFLHLFDVHAPYRQPPPYDTLFVEEPMRPDGRMEHVRRIGSHRALGVVDEAPSVAWIRARYDAGIARVDAELARLFEGLREQGRWEGALIVVTSDHGEGFFERGLQIGHGLFLYDEQLRIPLIVKLPARLGLAGLVVEEPVSLVDVMPTILDALELPISSKWQGGSLLPLARAAREGRPAASDPERAVYGSSSNTGGTAFVRTARWKYIEPLRRERDGVVRALDPDPEIEADVARRIEIGARLYDLWEDPGETTNLVAKRREKAAWMAALLTQHRSKSRSMRRRFTARRNALIEPGQRERLRELGYAE